MSESTHYTISQLAADLVESRALLATLKRERRACVCECESKPDYAVGDRGDPPCWLMIQDNPDWDPEGTETCDPCKKRIAIHPKVVEASKVATKAWAALKRAVNKAKKTEA